MTITLARGIAAQRVSFLARPTCFESMLPLNGGIKRIPVPARVLELREETKKTIQQVALELRYLGADVSLRSTLLARCEHMPDAVRFLQDSLITPDLQLGVLVGDCDDSAIFRDTQGRRYLIVMEPDGVLIYRNGRMLEFETLNLHSLPEGKVDACADAFIPAMSDFWEISTELKGLGITRDIVIDTLENLMMPLYGHRELEKHWHIEARHAKIAKLRLRAYRVLSICVHTLNLHGAKLKIGDSDEEPRLRVIEKVFAHADLETCGRVLKSTLDIIENLKIRIRALNLEEDEHYSLHDLVRLLTPISLECEFEALKRNRGQ